MFVMKKAGRFAGLAALAASTALTGPGGALAQASVSAGFQVAQANPEELPPPEAQAPAEQAPPPEAPAEAEPPVEQAPPPAEPDPAPAPEPEPEPAPQPAPADEPALAEPAPVEEAAPPVEEPAPEPEPAEEAEPAPEAAAPAEEPVPAEEAPAEPAPEPVPSDEAAPPAEEAAPAADEPAAPPIDTPADETAPISEEPADATPDQAPRPEDSEPATTEPSLEGEAGPSDEAEPAPAAEGEAPADPVEPAPAAEDAPAASAMPDQTEEGPLEATDPTAPIADPAAPDAPDAAVEGQPAEGEPAPQLAPQDGTGADTPTVPPAEPDAPAEVGVAPDQQAAEPAETPEPVAADIQTEPVPEDDLAGSDARVQTLAQPITEIPSATSEQGQRIENQTIDNSTTNQTTNNTTVNNTTINNTTVLRGPEPELPPGAEVVERVGDRDILSIVGAGVVGAVAGGAAAYFIRGDDTSRLATNAEDQYYERLGSGRVRETIVRPNGVQVVTITNRYGETIQRSRIMPDGREMVLFYDPYADEGAEPRYYYDPGADLPPIDLTIPEDDYIVDIAEPDEDLYYRTIVAPPVETVERIYSVDEVRRSKRIRDKVRRIDLSTINFAFGSDAIDQAEVGNLQALAEAISTVIDRNPSETFLVEGHTDAVGSDLANLALSDRRAEAVASALTDYFEIPPENLITQGYGEEFLKVNTDEPSAENRRVTVRRITPLVKPVQTSNR